MFYISAITRYQFASRQQQVCPQQEILRRYDKLDMSSKYDTILLLTKVDIAKTNCFSADLFVVFYIKITAFEVPSKCYRISYNIETPFTTLSYRNLKQIYSIILMELYK